MHDFLSFTILDEPVNDWWLVISLVSFVHRPLFLPQWWKLGLFHPNNMAFSINIIYHGWLLWTGPHQKKDCHWHLPFPIQGAVMPASCASIADEPTWLHRQMVLNHHGHYVTVIISTSPKVGQSGSIRRFFWVNMMNKIFRFWVAMGQNHCWMSNITTWIPSYQCRM